MQKSRLAALASISAVAVSALTFAPAHAAVAAPVTIRQSDLISGLSDTRSAGSVSFLADGLRVKTTDATSQAKAAEYFSVSGSLPTSASLDWSGTQPQASTQIVFDADGITGNGNDYNVLVGEPAYGDSFWLTNGSSKDAKAADPSGAQDGGNGSAYFGTLADWKAALPEARVYAAGFSLGSGVLGQGVIHSITVGDDVYTFTNAARESVTVRQSDLITDLADTRTAGSFSFLKDGLRLKTTDSTSQAKVAEYFPADGALPRYAAIDWTGTQPQASTQIVFDADDIAGNGNDYNVLVGEPVYNGSWWLTNGSSDDAKAADPSGANNGGNGSAYFGTLADWKAALPEARVHAAGFSLGSGVQGSGVISSITVGDTDYRFTSDAASITPAEPLPPVTVNVTGSKTVSKAARTARVALVSRALPADSVEGKLLSWTIAVDGKTAFSTKQHFGDKDRWTQRFAKRSGAHQVQIFKNGTLVRTFKVHTHA